MSIEITSLIVDFGLVVLVALVQWVIYPSFLYYSTHQLEQWHNIYTRRLTYIVFPLMSGQLVLHGLEVFWGVDLMNAVAFALVIATWGITILYAMPLHQNISMQRKVTESCRALIRVNAWRTFIWMGIFVIQCISFFLSS